MNKILIADIGVEGGGTTIFGSQTGGIWSYWTEGTSMDLDDNDDEVWRSWSSVPVSSLDLVVPAEWPMFYPSKIHPDFLEWFRANYAKARASMSQDERRSQESHRHGHWQELLGLAR